MRGSVVIHMSKGEEHFIKCSLTAFASATVVIKDELIYLLTLGVSIVFVPLIARGTTGFSGQSYTLTAGTNSRLFSPFSLAFICVWVFGCPLV